MREPYSNQAELDAIEAQIKQLSPELKLTHFNMKIGSRHVYETGLTIPIRGNKELIKRLFILGFRKEARRTIPQDEYGMIRSYSLDLMIAVPPKEEDR